MDDCFGPRSPSEQQNGGHNWSELVLMSRDMLSEPRHNHNQDGAVFACQYWTQILFRVMNIHARIKLIYWLPNRTSRSMRHRVRKILPNRYFAREFCEFCDRQLLRVRANSQSFIILSVKRFKLLKQWGSAVPQNWLWVKRWNPAQAVDM